MLVTKENRDYYIKRMARHYGNTIEEIEESVKDNPERLEGFAEHLANDYEDDRPSHRNYGGKYYE